MVFLYSQKTAFVLGFSVICRIKRRVIEKSSFTLWIVRFNVFLFLILLSFINTYII